MSEEKQVTTTQPTQGFQRRPQTGSTTPSRNFPSRNRTPGEARGGRFGSRVSRPGDKPGSAADSRGGRFPRRGNDKRDRKPREDAFSDFTSEVIQIRRVTRVVKGGKRMRFSALVVIGDKNGRVGFGLEKGSDFQDAVAKATRQAKKKIIRLNMDEAKSVSFPINLKYKASKIMLKPAQTGTGLIAGGFIRPILALAGYENIYSKIIGSANKVVGVQSVFKALEKFAK